MTEDTTFKPSQAGDGSQELQHGELLKDKVEQQEMVQQQVANTAHAVICPQCGAENDADAMFCASCGAGLRKGACPYCGSEVDTDADFCEVCHRYIKINVCSFCGASMDGSEQFCPQCGSPRGGIVCPTCHTLNDFSFCRNCGTPLTDEAFGIMEEVKQQPEYEKLVAEAKELMELQKLLPYTSERDLLRDRKNSELRERVLTLLAKDEGITAPVIPPKETKRLSEEELNEKKEKVMSQIAMLLDRLAIPPQPSPAKVRNYAMAQKPVGLRLAWICNYKQAMHSSPCGCAKPQLGGKWVILGKNQNATIVNDNE
jgi:predicted amidophosphoribosyltransferase